MTTAEVRLCELLDAALQGVRPSESIKLTTKYTQVELVGWKLPTGAYIVETVSLEGSSVIRVHTPRELAEVRIPRTGRMRAAIEQVLASVGEVVEHGAPA